MQRPRALLALLTLAIGLLVVACAGSGDPAGAQSASTPTSVPVATQAASAVASPSAAPSATASSPTSAPSTPAASAPSSSAGAIRYDVASGTTASYRVREQLARLNAPSDAVGKTSAVTGSIVVTPDGKVVSDESKITVDMTKLQSDSSLRDGFISRTTLQTSTYPTAVFVPTAVQGLSTIPTSGQQTFQLAGNLTVHGVTKPVTWDVTSQVQGGDVTGQATVTGLKFEDFGMTPPQAGAVLSVNDDITLDVSFHLTRAS